MNSMMRLAVALGAGVCGAVTAGGAMAAGTNNRIDLSTVTTNHDVHWLVYEHRGSYVVDAAPTYGVLTYGSVAGFSIPFTDNDGYWTAKATFTLPATAQFPVLYLQNVGVDDRAVMLLNGQEVTDLGTTSAGNGYMTYVDGGPNQPRTFSYKSGPQDLSIRSGFVAGVNTLQVVVNNTNEGILGVPVPVNSGSPSTFGLTGGVLYVTPAP